MAKNTTKATSNKGGKASGKMTGSIPGRFINPSDLSQLVNKPIKSVKNNDKMTGSIYGNPVKSSEIEWANRPSISEEYEEDFNGVDIKRDRFTSTASDVGKAKYGSKGKAAVVSINKSISGGKGKSGKSK